jgi:hypothetical protein
MGHRKLGESYYTVEHDGYHITVVKNTLERGLFGYIKETKVKMLEADFFSILGWQFGPSADKIREGKIKDAAERLFGNLNWKE